MARAAAAAAALPAPSSKLAAGAWARESGWRPAEGDASAAPASFADAADGSRGINRSSGRSSNSINGSSSSRSRSSSSSSSSSRSSNRSRPVASGTRHGSRASASTDLPSLTPESRGASPASMASPPPPPLHLVPFAVVGEELPPLQRLGCAVQRTGRVPAHVWPLPHSDGL